MIYGADENIKNETLYFTDKIEEAIHPFESLKDLGVTMNSNANFQTQVTFVTKISRQKMEWILQSFHNRNIKFMKHMYKTVVTPHKDNYSQLWMPTDCSEVEQFEIIKIDFSEKFQHFVA